MILYVISNDLPWSHINPSLAGSIQGISHPNNLTSKWSKVISTKTVTIGTVTNSLRQNFHRGLTISLSQSPANLNGMDDHVVDNVKIQLLVSGTERRLTLASESECVIKDITVFGT
ncbi:hypothetical protein ACTXT7_015012 [Hymenolepis weldensis]